MRVDEFKGQVEFGLENLDRIHANLVKFSAKTEDDEFKLSALAYECMGYYNAIEHLMIRALKFSSITIPTGAFSHRDTLSAFQTLGHPHMSPGIFKTLADLMGFRHVATKIYGFLLDADKLQRLLDQVSTDHEDIKQLFLSFVHARAQE